MEEITYKHSYLVQSIDNDLLWLREAYYEPNLNFDTLFKHYTSKLESHIKELQELVEAKRVWAEEVEEEEIE